MRARYQKVRSWAQIEGVGIFKINKTKIAIIDTIIKRSTLEYYDTAEVFGISKKHLVYDHPS